MVIYEQIEEKPRIHAGLQFAHLDKLKGTAGFNLLT